MADRSDPSAPGLPGLRRSARRRMAAVAVAVAALAAACGGGDTDDAGAAAGSGAGDAGAAAEETASGPMLAPAVFEVEATTVGGESFDFRTVAERDAVLWFWAPW
ncbi:MAG: hypothetical protein AAF547_05760 [Actinomycetota bacterium]